jgi:hypothetical protein
LPFAAGNKRPEPVFFTWFQALDSAAAGRADGFHPHALAQINRVPINIFFGVITIFFVKKKIKLPLINIFFGKKIKLFVTQAAGISVVRVIPVTKQLFPLHLIN